MFCADENGNEIAPERILAIGSCFMIAQLDRPVPGCVGLFIEDDENYFLKTTFSPFWLKDLITVASVAVSTLETLKNLEKDNDRA